MPAAARERDAAIAAGPIGSPTSFPELRGGLSDGRTVAPERRAAHVTRLVDRERPGAMHGLTVVPHHQVADLPLVGVHEFALGRVLDQVTQEQASLRDRPA